VLSNSAQYGAITRDEEDEHISARAGSPDQWNPWFPGSVGLPAIKIPQTARNAREEGTTKGYTI
jgi:hypothetical protein